MLLLFFVATMMINIDCTSSSDAVWNKGRSRDQSDYIETDDTSDLSVSTSDEIIMTNKEIELSKNNITSSMIPNTVTEIENEAPVTTSVLAEKSNSNSEEFQRTQKNATKEEEEDLTKEVPDEIEYDEITEEVPDDKNNNYSTSRPDTEPSKETFTATIQIAKNTIPETRSVAIPKVSHHSVVCLIISLISIYRPPFVIFL